MNEREENELISKLIEKYNVPTGKVLVHPRSEKIEERGHSATADAEHNNGQMNHPDCSEEEKTEDSSKISLPGNEENIDENALILDYKIENMANQCFIINKNRKRVYAGSGKLKILDGKIYRISYNRSAISIHLIEWDEIKEKFRLGERIVYEQKDSSLYLSLDREMYLEQIKAITYEQISREYRVEIDDSFHRSIDEKTDLFESKRVIPTKPRKEPKTKKECSSVSQAVQSKCDLEIVDMSQRTIAVRGNIEPHMRAFTAMGGYAVVQIDDEPGCLFSSQKREILQAYINENTSVVYSRKDKSEEKTVVYSQEDKNKKRPAVHFREDTNKKKTQRNRLSRLVIKVRFPNGKVLSSKNAGSTLIDVILYAGPEKVRHLKINSLGDNLVSHALSKNPLCRAVQKRIDNGLYVCVCSSVETIYRQILMIDYGCNLGLEVEKVFLDDYVPDKKEKTKTRRDAFKKRNDLQNDLYKEKNDSQDEIDEDVNDSEVEIDEDVNDSEVEIDEDENDSEDDIYEEDISEEGKIGDTIRLLPSQKKCEIIGKRVDHEGYEKLVLRTADYRLKEIDNNPYLYIVLKRK